MKHMHISVIILLCFGTCLQAKRTIVDEISAVVYCDGPRIVLASESAKPDLDGRPRTLKDAVLDELLLCEAQKFHVTVTAEDVNKYMGELQKNNRMTRAGMERAMEEMGYTYQEGLERLRRRQTIEQVIDTRVRGDSRFLISREEVMAFNNANPVWEPAVYTLVETVIDDSQADKKEFSIKELDALSWEEPFEVKDTQLADDKQFIADANVGEIVFKEPLGSQQYELTRLVAKKPRRKIELDDIVDPKTKRTLYDIIVDRLRVQRYEELIDEYAKSLMDKASVRFTHGYDKEKVLGSSVKN